MFDPNQAEFWVLLAFILFVGFVIWKGAPGLVGSMLDARAAAIRTELDEARRLREEAQQLLSDYQRKSREVETEAKVIIEQAKREAEALAAETRKSLAEQVERRTKAAHDKIARAEAQAVGEVRAAAVDLAIAASEKILKTRITGDAADALTEDSIRDLDKKLN